MFPLSEELVSFLPFLAGLGGTSLLVALGHARVLPRWVRWLPAPLWIALVCYFVRDFHGEYAGLGVMFASVLGLALWLAGTSIGLVVGWAFGTRRSARGKAPLVPAIAGLAVLPALVAIGLAVWRQTLPDASCATATLPVQIAGHVYHVHPQFRMRIDLTPGSSSGASNALFYQSGAARKGDRARLCRMSGIGSSPIMADQLWWTPASEETMSSLHNACTESRPSERPHWCAGRPAPRTLARVQSIKITDWTADPLKYERMWFRGVQSAATGRHGARRHEQSGSAVYSRGDRRTGSVCLEALESGNVGCFLWRDLGQGDLIKVETMRAGPEVTRAAHLVAGRAVMDYTLDAFAQ